MDLPHVADSFETKAPLVLIDTSNCGLHEKTVKNDLSSEKEKGKQNRKILGEGSKANEGEVEIVKKYVDVLMNAGNVPFPESREHCLPFFSFSLSPTIGLKPEEIGIISPYNAQVDKLRSAIREHNKLPVAANTVKQDVEKIEISTVDGFQGREKEVIIISFVRSNDKGEIGFLSEVRRIPWIFIMSCIHSLLLILTIIEKEDERGHNTGKEEHCDSV